MSKPKKDATSLLSGFLDAPINSQKQAPTSKLISFRLPNELLEQMEGFVMKEQKKRGLTKYSLSKLAREAIEAYISIE